MGNSLDGWAGERWLDTRSANVREIMKSRLDLAVSRGCDGVEPDNVDGYTNKPGFPLTSATQLDYNRFLATEARSRGLAVALKNTVDLLTQLEPYFDFAVNEQCNEYNECGGYSVFTSKGKPVFNAEYKSLWKTDATARASLCAASRRPTSARWCCHWLWTVRSATAATDAPALLATGRLVDGRCELAWRRRHPPIKKSSLASPGLGPVRAAGLLAL